LKRWVGTPAREVGGYKANGTPAATFENFDCPF